MNAYKHPLLTVYIYYSPTEGFRTVLLSAAVAAELATLEYILQPSNYTNHIYATREMITDLTRVLKKCLTRLHKRYASRDSIS